LTTWAVVVVSTDLLLLCSFIIDEVDPRALIASWAVSACILADLVLVLAIGTLVFETLCAVVTLGAVFSLRHGRDLVVFTVPAFCTDHVLDGTIVLAVESWWAICAFT